MPHTAAIQEKLKRFEESNALNVSSTKAAAANTIHSHQTLISSNNNNQKSSTNAYLPIYSHQQQQQQQTQQTSANQDILFNASERDERQMVTAAKGGFANENRVSKYLKQNHN